MEEINRRSALTIGLATAAATPLFALATPTGAAEIVPKYGPNDGKELAPGVRLVEVGKWDSDMKGIKSVLVLDVVFQPGAADKESVMDNDMVCFMVVVQTLEVEPIRGLEVALDHAASTAFQISGAVLYLTRSLSSLN